ncbi:hypothetical protein DENSPDRAFT_429921 [Dentipellis sp. KUC8613]|nr:hypothetical protein DENSPDRAFT_429921 [Dentipellis sp. KUC8613]
MRPHNWPFCTRPIRRARSSLAGYRLCLSGMWLRNPTRSICAHRGVEDKLPTLLTYYHYSTYLLQLRPAQWYRVRAVTVDVTVARSRAPLVDRRMDGDAADTQTAPEDSSQCAQTLKSLKASDLSNRVDCGSPARSQVDDADLYWACSLEDRGCGRDSDEVVSGRWPLVVWGYLDGDLLWAQNSNAQAALQIPRSIRAFGI